MKISRDGPGNTPKTQPPTSVAPSYPLAAPRSTSGSGYPTDQVQLSAFSNYLAAALSGSPAHQVKLAQLTTAVSDGHYHVDAGIVSASVIQHSLEFGGSGYSRLSTLRNHVQRHSTN